MATADRGELHDELLHVIPDRLKPPRIGDDFAVTVEEVYYSERLT